MTIINNFISLTENEIRLRLTGLQKKSGCPFNGQPEGKYLISSIKKP
jgi:hypothetical protein